MTRNYREAYGLFTCNGILFNHESERRGDTFVTKKIAVAAAKIALGKQDSLVLGNLDAVRDWGYAPEYAEGMWMMLQHKNPDDFVLATNTGYSVRDFLKLSFDSLNLEWEKYVEFDERYTRPTEVDSLVGDYQKAAEILGWRPKTLTPSLARIMTLAEYSKLNR